MKARVVYWGTTSALYVGPGSFQVFLLHCNKKFQVRIETAGKPIWSTYFDTLPEATEWAYKHPEGEPAMTVEALIKKYKIEGTDAKELRDFSEFLRQRKKEKQERVFAECNVQVLHPGYTKGEGTVYRIPRTEQTRTMHRWVIRGNNGQLFVSDRDTDDQSKAEEQLKKVMEALGL